MLKLIVSYLKNRLGVNACECYPYSRCKHCSAAIERIYTNRLVPRFLAIRSVAIECVCVV